MERFLQIIDQVAHWWLYRRLSHATNRDPALGATFTSLEARQSTVTLKTHCPWMGPVMVGVADLLDYAGANNYFEIEGIVPNQMPPRVMRILFQWADGISPADRAQKLAIELNTVKAELRALKGGE